MKKLINKAWFTKYEPQSIDDLVFDSENDKILIQSWLQNDRIDGNILFHGPGGVGKTATARILIRHIIGNIENNYCRMRSRSVSDIDNELNDFLRRPPIGGKQKIVYMEEFDKMSNTALNELKEDKLELYQDTTVYICCTNNLAKFNTKELAPLLTRFTFKIPFNGKNINGIFDRLCYILDNENAQYDKIELKDFITNNIHIGIREIINLLQLSYISNNGKINYNDINKLKDIEEKVVQTIINILKAIASCDLRTKKLCCVEPLSSPIATDWTLLCTIIHNNYDINYDIIFDNLMNQSQFIPVKIIIAKYSDMSEFKKYPHMNLIACVYEIIEAIAKLSL